MKLLSKLVLAALLILPIASLLSLYLMNPSLSTDTSGYGDGSYLDSYSAVESGMTIQVWNNLAF
jgi:hypothetical protein